LELKAQDRGCLLGFLLFTHGEMGFFFIGGHYLHQNQNQSSPAEPLRLMARFLLAANSIYAISDDLFWTSAQFWDKVSQQRASWANKNSLDCAIAR